jgi:hypothetical protein
MRRGEVAKNWMWLFNFQLRFKCLSGVYINMPCAKKGCLNHFARRLFPQKRVKLWLQKVCLVNNQRFKESVLQKNGSKFFPQNFTMYTWLYVESKSSIIFGGHGDSAKVLIF